MPTTQPHQPARAESSVPMASSIRKDEVKTEQQGSTLAASEITVRRHGDDSSDPLEVPTVPRMVCAWCHAEMRAGSGDPKRVSHGICPPCKARVLKDAGLELKKEPIE